MTTEGSVTRDDKIVIFNWTAKRSGAGITVIGADSNGKFVSMTGITIIEREKTTTIARHPDGDAFLS